MKHGGFRAIGVGDCLYRLIMRWAVVQVSAKELDIVKSGQFAIKVSGGAEVVKHNFDSNAKTKVLQSAEVY